MLCREGARNIQCVQNIQSLRHNQLDMFGDTSEKL